ncbi:MAG: pentapeptide repeat-containing protein [Proteobacteria bacterium]|nr:pentapeptide repeat-containing protein [Pseudomonadota bacterium]
MALVLPIDPASETFGDSMSAREIILSHDRWRRGVGGAPAGLAGESDANAYAGLNLDLAQFTSSSFSGSSFASTTFREAVWTDCQFRGVTFSGCDLTGMAMTRCSFTSCLLVGCTLDRNTLQGCLFTACEWERLTLHNSAWTAVQLLECHGSFIEGRDMWGEKVKWEGSRFKAIRLQRARINLSM